MMISKNKNISLFVKTAKKTTGDACIVASIGNNFKKEHFDMIKLKTHKDIQMGIDHTVLAYCIFQCVSQNLISNPLAGMKGKVSTIKANIKNGSLNISVNTQPSLTHVRKCINSILKCLTPRKMYSIYDKNMKSVGQKSNRSVFNKCANEVSKSIAEGVKLAVIGKMSLLRTRDGKQIPEQKTLENLLSKLKVPDQGTKLTPEEKVDSSKAIPSHTEKKFPFHKCSDMDSILLTSYIDNTVKIPYEVVDGGLLIYNNNWETAKKKLADKNKIKTFVSSKMTHKSIKEFLPEILGYRAASSGNADVNLVQSLIKGKFSEKDIVERLLKCLK